MQSRLTRNVSLTPEFETFITDSLASGNYANASEVVRAGLRALRDAAIRPAAMPDWPVDGGECGALIRERDWSRTSLGAVGAWSRELRTTVNTIVNSPVAKVLMWGPDHVMLYNDAYRQIAGHRHPTALGNPVATMFPEVWDWNRTVLEAGFRGEVVSHRDQPIIFQRPNGPDTMFLDLFYTPVYEVDGRVGGVMCTIVDNSRRIAAERQLAISEAELRAVTDALPMLVAHVDRDHVYRFANITYEAWFGRRPEEIVGRPVREIVGEAFYEDRRASFERALAGETFSTESSAPRQDGGLRHIELRYVPRVEADGAISGFYVLGIDIEDRARREAELAASNKRFRTAMDAVHGVLWTNSADGRMVGEQPGWAALTGQSFEAYQGFGWTAAVHPEDIAATLAGWTEALASKSMFVAEHRVRQQDGPWRTFAIRAMPILDVDGTVAEWVGVHTDITHRRAAEAALRQQAEALVRQVAHRERGRGAVAAAQRDAGGPRHCRDGRAPQGRGQADPGAEDGSHRQAHGRRRARLQQPAAGRVRQSATARQGTSRATRGPSGASRTPWRAFPAARSSPRNCSPSGAGRRSSPRWVNVTRFVRSMDDMLRRAIGEGIEIETVFGGGLWNTFVDPVQIENALLNLAINARDAMNGAGHLTIELTNAHLDDAYARTHEDVTPGQYVLLAVSDTGCGIPPEVLAKVFEPFFSTKGEGKGSGLGLSMVYGFVKQSGGHVKIYSEPGHGTTIKLYLPRALDSEDVEVAVESGPVSGRHRDRPGGRGRCRGARDRGRDPVRSRLSGAEGRGCHERAARRGKRHPDRHPVHRRRDARNVEEPGAGPQGARAPARHRGSVHLRLHGNSIVHGGRLDAGVELLSKPYTREALARKFQHVLAGHRQRKQQAGPVPTEDQREEARITPPPATVDSATVLLVEDDALIRGNTAEILKDAGFVVMEAGSAEDAMIALQTAPVDVLVTDVNLPGASGPELAARARALRPSATVVYATGDAGAVVGDARTSVLPKPYGAAALLAAIREHARFDTAGAEQPATLLAVATCPADDPELR